MLRDAIKASLIVEMVDTLEPLELGVAVRILARLIEKKKPLPVKTLHVIAGVDKDSWETMKENVLPFFAIEKENVLLKNGAHPIESISQVAAPKKKGVTAPLFLETPKGAPKPETLPAYLASRPVPVSIRKAIYDTGIRVLMERGGASEKIARTTIASWLKAYPESAIAEAIAAAKEQTELNDPHSWIVARLRAAARGVRVHPASAAPTTSLPRAKPGDNNGMSDKTFHDVLQKNKTLTARRLGVSFNQKSN